MINQVTSNIWSFRWQNGKNDGSMGRNDDLMGKKQY